MKRVEDVETFLRFAIPFVHAGNPSAISKAGWSLGCISAVDSEGQTIWIVDAHRGDGRRFIVRADEILSAFVELELAIS